MAFFLISKKPVVPMSEPYGEAVGPVFYQIPKTQVISGPASAPYVESSGKLPVTDYPAAAPYVEEGLIYYMPEGETKPALVKYR